MQKKSAKIRANKWLYKIYHMLNNTEMKFALNRKLRVYGTTTLYAGGSDEPDARITVHPEKKEFMSTIVHECLHLVDWDMTENQVIKLERLLMKHLTDRQLLNLLRRIIIQHTGK